MAITKQYRIEIQLDDAQAQLQAAQDKLNALDASLEGLDRDGEAAKRIVADMAKVSREIDGLEKQAGQLADTLDSLNPGETFKPGQIGAFRNEVKRLEEELDQAEFGTPQAEQLIRELGRVKAQLKDVDEAVDVAFDKDKAGAYADAAAGIGGAFQIGAVAAQNLGLASEESAEKYQQKLLELLNVVGGLEQVHKLTTSEVSTALKGLGGDIKRTILGFFGIGEASTAAGGAAKASANTTRIALASIGIGALLLLLGLVVANWDKITGAVERNREKIVGALKIISPPIGALISLLEVIERKFGGIGQLAAGVGKAIIEGFSSAGDVLAKLFSGDLTGALDEARKFGTRTSEAFDAGVREKNAELAQEREKEAAKLRADGLKRQITEAEAAGKDAYALKKQQLEDELLLLDKSAKDYAKQLADKQSEIRVLTLAHTKKLADDAEKDRKTESDKQKAATEKAKKEAEDRYAKLRAAQKEASEKEAADNEEARKRKIAQARAFGGSQQAILRAEIDAAKDRQVELITLGQRYGSEYLELQASIREKEAAITDANLADAKKAAEQRVAVHDSELNALDELQYGRLSRMQRAGATERQLDEQRLADLKAQALLIRQQGRDTGAAYEDLLNIIYQTEQKLKPKALSIGDLILTRIFGVGAAQLEQVKASIAQSAAYLSDALGTLSSLYFENQAQQLEAQIGGHEQSLDSIKERGQQLEQDLNSARSAREALESRVDKESGARREATLQRIGKEREAETRLARQKAQNDAAELRTAKLKEDAEKRRQELQKKTQQLSDAATAANNLATASEAVLAAVRAVSGANKVPFPGNLVAVVAALAATGAAIASAKKVGDGFKKEKGGLLTGPSHALGGIPFGNHEVEGLEFVTKRSATANNLSTLETINRYGDRVEFIAVPKPKGQAAGGGQLAADGGVSGGSAGAPAVLSSQQAEQMIALLGLVVGHTAATAAKDLSLNFDGPTSKRVVDNANRESQDAAGGRLF